VVGPARRPVGAKLVDLVVNTSGLRRSAMGRDSISLGFVDVAYETYPEPDEITGIATDGCVGRRAPSRARS